MNKPEDKVNRRAEANAQQQKDEDLTGRMIRLSYVAESNEASATG